LCFVPVSSTTGKDLASTILTQLSQLGLNLEHMRGQGYDGASNMSGKYRGVQALVYGGGRPLCHGHPLRP